MALKCHVGDQSKVKNVLAEQHVPKSARKVCILTMLAGPKKVCERISAPTRLAVLARNLSTFLLSNFSQVSCKQTFSTNILGSPLCWLGTVVLARNRFPNTHQLKHTSFQKDQVCKDTFFCVLNKTWTFRTPKSFYSTLASKMPHSLSADTPLLSATRSMRTLCFLKNWVH